MLKRFGIHVFYLFSILILIFINACKEKSGDHIDMEGNNAFSAIVAFQDSIVLANTPGFNTIESAYMHYLDSVCPLIMSKGNFSQSGIDAKVRRQLFEKLPEDELSEIFHVGDTIEYFSMDVKRRVKKYFPYHVTINTDGQFAGLLETMSDAHPFISKFYTNMLESGSISPTCYGMVLRDYDQLDFSNPGHRLLYTVTILSVNETIKDRFAH
jgi:hypothetical protein